jgi:tetratricopeptide (TPR) repeat protein
MQGYGKQTNKGRRLTHCAIASAFFAMATIVPQGRAQFNSRAIRSTIEGSVMIDGDTQPASRVRVNVKGLSGTEIATAYTDSSGRFVAAAEGTDTVIVAVDEQGYEPVEQRVDVSYGGSAALVITLRKLRAAPVEHTGYTVSLRDLKLPAKARHAYEKGLTLLQKKDAEASLDHFKEATSAYPSYYEAYYQIGLANMELRRSPDAEQALQRSIDLSGGGYAEPQFALGALLCDRQQYQEAERVLRRSIEVDSTSWKGYLFLGQAQFGLNQLSEAEKNAREVLLRHSDTPPAYILLANIHIRRHEYILGIQDLDTYLAMKPTGTTSQQAREVRAAAQKVMSRLQQTIVPPVFVY